MRGFVTPIVILVSLMFAGQIVANLIQSGLDSLGVMVAEHDWKKRGEWAEKSNLAIMESLKKK